MSKEWNHYLDEITDADVEFEDIRRIIKTMDESGIDSLDATKVMTDLCSLRYRFGFFFMSYQAIHLIVRPKGCIHEGYRDISRAAKVLKSLRLIMREVFDEFEGEGGCDHGKTQKEGEEGSGDSPEEEGREEGGKGD